MLGVGIHIHFRLDTPVKIDDLRGRPVIEIDDLGDASVSIYPGIDGLRRLYAAIGGYLAEHDAPSVPPIPAEAATDDAEALPEGWSRGPHGLPRHEDGDYVARNSRDSYGAYARRHGTTFNAFVGTFPSEAAAIGVLDAARKAATDDAESLPPGWRATDCGYEHESGDWVDASHMDAYARAYAAGHRLIGRFAAPIQAMQALDARRRDLDDDTGEFDTRDIVAALDEADRAALFAPPEVR